MPTPAPPAPRIAYDDPSIARVLVSRQAVAKITGNEQVWIDAHPDSVPYMNVPGLRASVWVPTHDPDQYTFTTIWPGATGTRDCIFEVVFQTPHVIRGIEILVEALSDDSEAPIPVNLESIHSPDDPFGTVTTDRGILTNPSYTYAYFPLAGGLAQPPPTSPEMRHLTTFAPWDNSPFHDDRIEMQINAGVAVHQLALTDVVALRFSFRPRRNGYSGGSVAVPQVIKMNLYGYPEESDYLGFVSTTLTTPVSPDELFWGDVTLGSSGDRSFRVKNYHATDTAVDIDVSAENGPEYDAPEPHSQFLFSMDEITWTPTVTLASLSPGAVSPTIHVRRVTSENSTLGRLYSRFRAEAGGWS